MARLFGYGSIPGDRRRSLSQFATCVDDAVHFGDPLPLANILKSDYQLTPEDKALLADYILGKFKRGRGNPNHKGIRIDWLADGARKYWFISNRWKKLSGGRTKYRRRDGSMALVRAEILQRVAMRLKHPGQEEKLLEYINRPKNRR